MEAVALFLQFVPLEGEPLDFFQPLTRQVLNLLRTTNCLPTDSDHAPRRDTPTFTSLVAPSSTLSSRGGGGGEGEELPQWKRPSQVLYVRDDFIRDHISQPLLERALSLSYLHPTMLPFLNLSLRTQLGVQHLTVDHLREVASVVVECFHGDGAHGNDNDDSVSSGTSGSEAEEGEGVSQGGRGLDFEGDFFSLEDLFTPKQLFVKWIANWLSCVHVLLEEGGGGGSGGGVSGVSVVMGVGGGGGGGVASQSFVKEKLGELPILPLADGSFVAAAQEGIFFPPDYRGVCKN